jgi:hypothetical protein
VGLEDVVGDGVAVVAGDGESRPGAVERGPGTAGLAGPTGSGAGLHLQVHPAALGGGGGGCERLGVEWGVTPELLGE